MDTQYLNEKITKLEKDRAVLLNYLADGHIRIIDAIQNIEKKIRTLHNSR